MVWLGRVFFFEWTVVIKWEDVIQVQKQNDGVRFTIRTKAVYDFVKLFHAERAWATLVSLHNDTVIDKRQREPTPRQVTRSLRRMNSDPTRMSFVFQDLDDELRFQNTSGSGIQASSHKQRRDTLSRSATVPVDKDMDVVEESVHPEESIDNKRDVHQQSLEKQWSTVIDTVYAETAVDKLELACTLDTFFEMFVADNAKYSIPTFMKESGDEEIQCSPWTIDEDGVTKSRTIEYTHPISAPMAPPMARARKEQTYKGFGSKGMVLETRTYVSDVPMTDCFYVADRILVEPIRNNNNNDDKVMVTMSFEMEFVKSTMFKAIIMRTTKGEFLSFMQRLASFMSKSLGQAAAASITPPILPATAEPKKELSQPSPVDLVPRVTLGLVCVGLALQFWIIWDLTNMKTTLRQLEINVSIRSMCKDSL